MIEGSGMEAGAVVLMQIEIGAREMRLALDVSEAYFSSICHPF